MIPLFLALVLACAPECPTPTAARTVPESKAVDVVDTADSEPVPCAVVAWYQDCDADGMGRSPVTAEYAAVIACESPTGDCAWVSVAGDCDDTDPATKPFAVEICDGRDNDCDSYIEVGPC